MKSIFNIADIADIGKLELRHASRRATSARDNSLIISPAAIHLSPQAYIILPTLQLRYTTNWILYLAVMWTSETREMVTLVLMIGLEVFVCLTLFLVLFNLESRIRRLEKAFE